MKMSVVRSSNISVYSGVTSKENLRIFFFPDKNVWGFNVYHMGKDLLDLPQLCSHTG